jgi:hypothetical protein
MLTVAEVDEALGHASRVPASARTPQYHDFVDRLLDIRALLEERDAMFETIVAEAFAQA